MITTTLGMMSLVFGIILIIPILCRRIHVPSIVGFILVGMCIGPHGLALLAQNDTISVLGKIGMLYIMFQSGSEIDLNDMKEHRKNAFLFGLYTFFIPMLLGLITSHYILGYNWLTSLLLGAMYGSHTLMTYPIVSRYDVHSSRPVNIVIGGTVMAITLSLLLLASVKASMVNGQWEILTAVKTLCLLTLLGAVVMWLFPKIAQWVLKRYQDPVTDFMLVMVLLVLAAYMAEYIGMDGILGAFLCGVALNRMLPNHSTLMHRVTFVGNAIFVPLFLLSVGMMIDARVFWESWNTIVIAIVMILTKIGGKSLAAYIIQRQNKMTTIERQLIFGLTHATAAGTLAIVSIGYQIGLLDSEVLNAAVLMILILCTTASFVTEYAAKQIALQAKARIEIDKDKDQWALFAMDMGTDEEAISKADEKLYELAALASLDRFDTIVDDAWEDVDNMIEHTSKSIAVYNEKQPLNTIERILVAVPRYAEKEKDFITCFGLVRRLSSELGAKVVFYSNHETEDALRLMCRRPGKFLRAEFKEMDDWEDLLTIAKDIREDDMLIIQSSRKSTASYNPLFQQNPDLLKRFFNANSYLVVYPEQQTGGFDVDAFLTDVPQTSRMWKIVSWVVNQFRKLQK